MRALTRIRNPHIRIHTTHACRLDRGRREIRALHTHTHTHSRRTRVRPYIRTIATDSFKEPRRYRRIPSKARYRHVTKKRHNARLVPR